MTADQAVRPSFFTGTEDLSPAEVEWGKALEPIKASDRGRYLELDSAANYRTSEAFDLGYHAGLSTFPDLDNMGAITPRQLVSAAKAAIERIANALELAERDL